MKTVYDALFGKYIGKEISLSENGFYIGGDWVSGRYYSGTLTGVKIENNHLVFVLNRTLEIYVNFKTEMQIKEEDKK